LVIPAGNDNAASELNEISRILKCGREFDRTKLRRRLPNKSRIVRFVNASAIWNSAKEFETKLRIFRFRAACNPATFVILNPPADKFVKLNKSDSARGPLGFCRVWRIAAFKPGSGMEIS
jgi:hypothetical protein